MRYRAIRVPAGQGLAALTAWSVLGSFQKYPLEADADNPPRRVGDDVFLSIRANRLGAMCRTYCTCSDTTPAKVRQP